jgi:hypothetical protein
MRNDGDNLLITENAVRLNDDKDKFLGNKKKHTATRSEARATLRAMAILVRCMQRVLQQERNKSNGPHLIMTVKFFTIKESKSLNNIQWSPFFPLHFYSLSMRRPAESRRVTTQQQLDRCHIRTTNQYRKYMDRGSWGLLLHRRRLSA